MEKYNNGNKKVKREKKISELKDRAIAIPKSEPHRENIL